MPRSRDKYLFDMLDAYRFLPSLTANESAEKCVHDRVFRGAGRVTCPTPAKSGAGM